MPGSNSSELEPGTFPLSRLEFELKRHLTDIVETGHALEKLWPSHDEAAVTLFHKLVELIQSCAGQSDSRFNRLHIYADKLSLEMTAKHLGAQLVPFERLLGRALRDDEFLITEIDKREQPRVTAPLTVIADNIRSAFNVGAILRTAECFGAEEVMLTGYSPTPDDIKTARTSLGAQYAVKWSHRPEAFAAIRELKERGYKIIALETALNAESITTFEWPEKAALILGNERFGIDHETIALAEHVVSIPLYGQKNSLNVGIALGVALGDWRTKLASPRAAVSASSAAATAPAATPGFLTLTPVATFHTTQVNPYEASRQGSVSASDEIGVVEFEKQKQFEQALESIEGFDRVWLIYGFHHNTNWKPQILPPRGPHKKRGVFATRAPYRPNPIGMSAVELLKVDGLKLQVRGFDLLDGTPIYDVKPYVAYADAFPNAKAGWLEKIESQSPAHQIELTEKAQIQLEWLEQNGVAQIRSFVSQQLEFDPLDSERKRISELNGHPLIAYRTWRIAFVVDQERNLVIVNGITSGYTASDLAAADDRYEDKALHRRFHEMFSV